ncbi:MAG: undecaprenyl-diphosphate phosphatase [Candidatus Diapherotrites archaeon]|nr:undecaprenyl-diphosphate phosphatase [Candidatus Diapherotrites archaeon]
MIDFVSAFFLGVLQGLAEWLPISSQGQVMVVAIGLLNLSASEALRYAVWLHLGTLLSAIVYFRKELLGFLQLKDKKLLKWLLVATVFTAPTGALAYLFLKKTIELTQSSTLLLLIGALLLFTGWLLKVRKKAFSDGKLSFKNAVIVGLSQGLAVLPGVSRSGTTTSFLLLAGFKPEQAFKLSFLMSIPAVLAAELLFGLDEGFVIDPSAIVAILSAAVVGFLSMGWLIKVAKSVKFWKFCVVFGVFLIVLALVNLVV